MTLAIPVLFYIGVSHNEVVSNKVEQEPKQEQTSVAARTTTPEAKS
jgi:hypothetical protein